LGHDDGPRESREPRGASPVDARLGDRGDRGKARRRRITLGVAFSMPALGTGIGLLLSPSLGQLVAFGCCVGVVLAVLRADTVERRVREDAQQDVVTRETIRSQFLVAGWAGLGLALLVAAALVPSFFDV
jgi:hypothetical protein